MLAKILKATLVAVVAWITIGAGLFSWNGVYMSILQLQDAYGLEVGMQDLPRCDNPQVVALLQRLVQSTVPDKRVSAVDHVEQVSFDEATQVRRGKCVVHTNAGDLPCRFLVKWSDQNKGDYSVQILSNVLPACDSPNVIALIEQALKCGKPGSLVKSLEGYQELRYDSEAQVRRGKCILHTTNSEDRPLRFSVVWLNFEEGTFTVRFAPYNLPECDSDAVKPLVAQLLRGEPNGELIKTIDSYQELSFDELEDWRKGKCVAHTENGNREVTYMVEWQDADQGRFNVRLWTDKLPEHDSPLVTAKVEDLMRGTPAGPTIEKIDSYEELRFDQDKQVRLAKCVVHTADQDVSIRFMVDWRNRDRAIFDVRLAPEPPSCNNADVKATLEQVVRRMNADKTIVSIDGVKELRYDLQADKRFGECVVHAKGGDFSIKFSVAWENRDKRQFLVNVLTEEEAK